MFNKNLLSINNDYFLFMQVDGKASGAAEVSKTFKGAEETILFLPIETVKPNPYQPRKCFDEKSLEELSVSVSKHGILQPILTEKISDNEYRIIAGERRYRAALKAGLKTVPVVVREFSNLERMEIAVTENVQRQDLNPIEEAMAYMYLSTEGAMSQEELSNRIGKSRSAIANSIRLLQLPQSMQDALLEEKLTAGHARALLQTKAPADRETLFNLIINEGLSVRSAENLANEFNNGGRAFHKTSDIRNGIALSSKGDSVSGNNTQGESSRDVFYDREIITTIQDKFIKLFGTNVTLSGTFNKGKLVISYNSYSNLEKIYERAGGSAPLVDEEE